MIIFLGFWAICGIRVYAMHDLIKEESQTMKDCVSDYRTLTFLETLTLG